MAHKSAHKGSAAAFGDHALLGHSAAIAHGTRALVHAMT